MKGKQILCIILLLLFAHNTLLAWNNHAGLTQIILTSYWKQGVPNQIPVESLEDFIIKERDSLPAVFAEIEETIAKDLPHYPKTPSHFLFQPESITQENAKQKFFHALRVNPNHQTTAYIQKVNIRAETESPLLNRITILNDKGKLVLETFEETKDGQFVSPLDVLVTAVDEPDYDLDLYLFSDNESEFGKQYGFGEQSFGNPKYEYSSQAPFHMGFYHEPAIIFSLAGFLKRTYPEYRIYQFTKLAEYAKKKGHHYWAYRFAGWALHYLQDLSQPYHASVLPRVSAGKQIGVQVLAMIGLTGAKNNMIDHVTQRHTLIEEYQYFLIKDLIHNQKVNHPVFKALQTSKEEDLKSPFQFSEVRNSYSKGSYELGEDLDESLEELQIPKYETLYEENHPIHVILAKALYRTNVITRRYLRSLSL
ncbi:hypothetical protein LPTSP4_15100 [Leptospira ryugenii]|uniref:Phospholipase n=1 Tax=Leptospira ryugenii TaxID=1917863 RepID=A0A2P2DZD4_9LEPT|nr:hypothetical protein [Leptospira ryugenii]GBF49989.1 hypothetical protein LPTSP4_15100 [Leptospira ryugenii]